MANAEWRGKRRKAEWLVFSGDSPEFPEAAGLGTAGRDVTLRRQDLVSFWLTQRKALASLRNLDWV